MEENQETNDVVETNVEATQETSSDKPDGYEQVDFATASPEQLQARFNRIYGQTKSFQKLASEQARVIEELQQSQNQVISHLNEKETQQTEAQLRAQLKEAHENGDTNAALAAQEKLMDLKVAKLAKAQQPQPKQSASNENSYFEGREVVDAWQNETDERGQSLRPWASEGHPDFAAAEALSLAYFSNPAYAHLSTEQKLAAIDKRFGVAKAPVSQSVMSSRLTSQPRTNKITLSPKAQEIAIRTRIAGPGKSNDEHIAAYAKLFKSTNGGRK